MAQDRTSKAQILVEAVDRLSEPVRRMNRRLNDLNKPIDRLTQNVRNLGETTGLNRLARQTREVSRAFTGLSHSVATVARRSLPLLAGAAIGGGGAVAGLGALTGVLGRQTAELQRQAAQIGVSVQELQRWQYAARRAGFQTDSLKDSLDKLNTAKREAIAGDEDMREAFGRLGVSVYSGEDQVKGANALLLDTIERLQQIQDAARRRKLAEDLFGANADEVLRLADKGVERIRELRQEADRTGNVLDPDQVGIMADFNRSVRRLLGQLNGLRKFLTVRLTPAVDELVEHVSGLLAKNRELIRSKLAEWAAAVSEKIRALADPTSELRQRIRSLVADMGAAWRAFADFAELVGGPFRAILYTTGALLVSPLVTAVASLTTALLGLGRVTLGVAMRGLLALVGVPLGTLAAGMGTVAAAATALAGAGYLIWNYWRPLGDFFDGFASSVIGPLRTAFAELSRALEPLAPLGRMIAGALSAVWSWITDLVDPVDQTKDHFEAWADAGRSVGYVVGKLLAGALRAVTLPFRAFAALVADVRWAMRGLADAAEWVVDKLKSLSSLKIGLPSIPTPELPALDTSALRRSWQNAMAWIRETIGGFRWPSLPAFEWPDLPAPDLSGLGAQAVDSLLAGMKAAWESVRSWFADQLAALNELVPSYLVPGLDKTGQAATAAQEPVRQAADAAKPRGLAEAQRITMQEITHPIRVAVPPMPTPPKPPITTLAPSVPDMSAPPAPPDVPNRPETAPIPGSPADTMSSAGGEAFAGLTINGGLNVTVQGGDGLDERGVAERIRAELDQWSRDQARIERRRFHG